MAQQWIPLHQATAPMRRPSAFTGFPFSVWHHA
jgi:hypothetical protein